MFDIGFGEMVLLAAIALIAIGPKQLPEVARTVGKFMAEFKKLLGDVSSTVANARDETNKTIHEIQDGVMKQVTKPLDSVPVGHATPAAAENAPHVNTQEIPSEQLAFQTEDPTADPTADPTTVKKPDGST